MFSLLRKLGLCLFENEVRGWFVIDFSRGLEF